MGGQSFKCPICSKWFLHPRAFHQHIEDKHHIHNFRVIGVGSIIKIEPRLDNH